MARLTVDGIEVDIEPGRTVLQAAEEAGVKIPTLCHHRALVPYGACRVCLVEVEISRGSRIEASCVFPAQDGLVVSTNTERVRRTRKVMVELLLARCPEARAVKELAVDLGIDETRFPKKQEDCILCGLCVRVCQERMGVGAINFAHRGPDRKITTPYDKHSPICMACGACQVVCPVDVVDLSKVTLLEPRPIPSDYDMGLARRSSIYLPFAQAIPKVATIDPDTCMHLLRGTCQACASFCEADAIDFDQQDEIQGIEVGAAVLAPGFQQFDPYAKKELGYGRFPNVISSLQFERILSASGPYLGKVLRPSDREGARTGPRLHHLLHRPSSLWQGLRRLLQPRQGVRHQVRPLHSIIDQGSPGQQQSSPRLPDGRRWARDRGVPHGRAVYRPGTAC
jgi:heterodisulfide reductase subunit A